MTGPDDPITIAWLAHACAVTGDRTEARALAERLATSAPYVSPYHCALAHAGLGEWDAAFASLDAACIDRDPMVALVAVEPCFEALRQDPRYLTLRDYLNLHRPAA